MSRSLRPRTSRPSYAVPLALGSDDELITPPEDDDASSDDFKPVNDQPLEAEGEVEDAESIPASDDMDMLDSDTGVEVDVTPEKLPSSSRTKPRPKTVKVKATTSKLRASKKPPLQNGPSFSRPSYRQHYALPMPSQEHRHRAIALFQKNARVERLSSRPEPFGPSVTAPTNNWAMDGKITDRYNKATGYNIGPGPLWDYMEDRSWWKESLTVPQGELETEATRRPRVYDGVRLHESLEVLNEISSQAYLPTRYDSQGSASSSIKCSFGPVDSQTQRDITLFGSVQMSEWYADARAHVFNAGGPVWALDWCPIFAEDQPRRRYKQYLAVAPLPSNNHTPHVGIKCTIPSPACIEIWSFGPQLERGENISDSVSNSKGEVKCELVVCMDSGPAHDLKWCPLPSHDSWSNSPSPRKLGILAGTFEDGTMSIFVVPDPEDFTQEGNDVPVYVKVDPVVKLAMENTCLWALDWANSERIAVGCTNGFVAVYDVKDAILSKTTLTGPDVLPSFYVSLHQSAIRTLQWVREPPVSANGSIQTSSDPTIIASGGFDGCVIYTDIRVLSGNIVNRTRDAILSMSYSAYAGGVVTIDQNLVKTYCMNPTMLARGHLLLETTSPAWSLHCSDYHPQLAVASADGSVVATNSRKSIRRSASTPFLSYKIFQMDYNRKTGEYRMLDQFKPQEINDKAGSSKSAKKLSSTTEGGTGAWPAEVSATRVSWNNGGGLARAPLLASATASGLCRIDWLEGMFLRDRQPYGGILVIRKEVDGGDADSDEDED